MGSALQPSVGCLAWQVAQKIDLGFSGCPLASLQHLNPFPQGSLDPSKRRLMTGLAEGLHVTKSLSVLFVSTESLGKTCASRSMSNVN